MKIELWNKIVDISKNKKDGKYSKQGWIFIVKNKNIEYVGNWFEGLYKTFGQFRTLVWNRDYSKDSYEAKKEFDLIIKKILKEIKC